MLSVFCVHQKVRVNRTQSRAFLTSERRFVDRFGGAAIAFQAGQIPKWEFGQGMLSEELWCPRSGGKHIYNEEAGYVMKGIV